MSVSMVFALRPAIERQLVDHKYRDVLAHTSNVWLPQSYSYDWQADGTKMVALYRRLRCWDSSGLHPNYYGVAEFVRRIDDKCGPYWTYNKPIFDRLIAEEAAICEAVAIAIDRGLPVCFDFPKVYHVLGDSALWNGYPDRME
jgi:hypothetical protein